MEAAADEMADGGGVVFVEVGGGAQRSGGWRCQRTLGKREDLKARAIEGNEIAIDQRIAGV